MIKPRKRKTNIQSKEKESKARNDKTTKKKRKWRKQRTFLRAGTFRG
jgi:hypothetical protein